MKRHRVRAGECLSSIAFETGFFWETLWTHPANLELKTERESPFTLVPGDEVVIPQLRQRSERIATDQRHRFRRRGVPAKLVVRFTNSDGSPRANLDYCLEIDDIEVAKGHLDGDGVLSEYIVPSARLARIHLRGGGETFELELGHLQPADTVEGIQGRLRSLGYYTGPIDGIASESLRHAIERFRLAHDLDPSTDDQAIRAAIAEAHDG